MTKLKTVLTIAGSDSSGGAGIQADLKTFSAHCIYGASVITVITAQNTTQVFDCKPTPPSLVIKQLDAVLLDLNIEFIKIGMLFNKQIIKTVANYFNHNNHQHKYKLVLDPVMISKSGFWLLKSDAITILIKKLIPICYLITPNILEATKIAKLKAIKTVSDMKKACQIIHQMGVDNVLIKGGHLLNSSQAIDVLYTQNKFFIFKTKRYNNNFTHGTGCTFSSAICARLTEGQTLINAVKLAKNYVAKAIKTGIIIGNGTNPVNHNYKTQNTKN